VKGNVGRPQRTSTGKPICLRKANSGGFKDTQDRAGKQDRQAAETSVMKAGERLRTLRISFPGRTASDKQFVRNIDAGAKEAGRQP
jgi:hypothetical protein